MTVQTALSNLIPTRSATHTIPRTRSPPSSISMALLAIQSMAMSAATALPSHNHGAVSSTISTSSYALTATAGVPRTRATLAVGAVASATVTPVLDGSVGDEDFPCVYKMLKQGICRGNRLQSGVFCGRGDKKTKRGKRFNHSYGNARPRNKKKGTGPPRLFAPPAPPRKDQFDDGEIIPIEIDEDILE